jgi:hypothetical protein
MVLRPSAQRGRSHPVSPLASRLPCVAAMSGRVPTHPQVPPPHQRGEPAETGASAPRQPVVALARGSPYTYLPRLGRVRWFNARMGSIYVPAVRSGASRRRSCSPHRQDAKATVALHHFRGLHFTLHWGAPHSHCPTQGVRPITTMRPSGDVADCSVAPAEWTIWRLYLTAPGVRSTRRNLFRLRLRLRTQVIRVSSPDEVTRHVGVVQGLRFMEIGGADLLTSGTALVAGGAA